MRRYLVAGNWKLHLGPAAGAALAQAVADGLGGMSLAGDVLVCPPYVTIPAVAAAVRDTSLLVGAQNCAAQEAGAYTGEVAAAMLAEAGATWVIVGHSERRSLFHETDADFTAKITRVHDAGLGAIFCYGETLEERRSGRAADVVRDQLTAVLPHVATATPENLVLAYEPVWAIGTGETATPEQAQEIHALSRGIAAEILGADTADRLRILYGGSVKPGNAADLLGRPDIDGGLVGGASLRRDDFLAIVRAAQATAA